jgi:hypothetical protein
LQVVVQLVEGGPRSSWNMVPRLLPTVTCSHVGIGQFRAFVCLAPNQSSLYRLITLQQHGVARCRADAAALPTPLRTTAQMRRTTAILLLLVAQRGTTTAAPEMLEISTPQDLRRAFESPDISAACLRGDVAFTDEVRGPASCEVHLSPASPPPCHRSISSWLLAHAGVPLRRRRPPGLQEPNPRRMRGRCGAAAAAGLWV